MALLVRTASAELSCDGDRSFAEATACTSVEGDLLVIGTQLASLDGLQNLTAVGGSLVIVGNGALAR